MTQSELKKIAAEIRLKVIRMAYDGRHCHIGSSFSEVELLAALYFKIMKHNPKRPKDPARDRLILSKGHGSAALYAILAKAGYFPKIWLKDFVKNGSPLIGHVNYHGVPGVEFSTGSLGHGLPVGLGMALALKKNKLPGRVFVILSDGELDEGSNWEAILAAANWRLDNLVVIVDYNKIQACGRVEEVMPLEPLIDKWQAFNWSAKELDGHNFDQIIPALSNLPFKSTKPSVLIAHTTKGKGVSFMENKMEWHYMTPTKEQLEKAERELKAYEK